MGLRVKNISEGYTDANGVFHPIRSASDYRAKRAGETKRYVKGAKASKAKRTVTVPHKRVAAKRTAAQIKAALKPKRRTVRKNPVSRGVLEIHDAQKQLTLYDSIKAGKSVTVRVRGGGTRSGRATMRGPEGWVLTPTKHTGNPPIAYPGNIVSVRAGKLPVAKSNPNFTYYLVNYTPHEAGTTSFMLKGGTNAKAKEEAIKRAPMIATKAMVYPRGGTKGFSVPLKRRNPLPIGKYIKAKVKRMANGDVKVMISR